MRILGVSFGLFAIGLVLNQAFNDAGDTWTPTRINIVAFWLVQLPLAYVLAKHVFNGPNGVFLAILVGESLMTVIAFMIFLGGQWKMTQI